MKQYEKRPFAIVGVNVNAYPVEKLKAFMTKENLTWRSFADEPEPADKKTGFYPGRIANAWKLDGTPNLWVVDHKGIIRHHWLGSPGDKVIDEVLAKLVDEAEKDAKAAR